MRTYFVTGATGFLGQRLVEKLTAGGAKVFALARKREGRKLPNLPVTWIEGDIETPDLCSHEDRQLLLAEVTDIIHAAALYDFTATKDAAYFANIVGTHHLIHFAGHCEKLAAFHYVSTMAVAGDYQGTFTEGMFCEGQTFPNTYASTKFAAEGCVREWRTDVPRFIYRLGILVGDSHTGEIPKVDGPYYLMRALSARKEGIFTLGAVLKRLPAIPLPFNERTRAYLVPVDAAAAAIARVAFRAPELTSKPIRVYHIMGEPGGVAVRTVLRKTLRHAGITGKIVSLPSSRAVSWIAEKLRIPSDTLHYMYSPCQFDTRRLSADFPEIRFPRFEEYADSMFRFASERLLQ